VAKTGAHARASTRTGRQKRGMRPGRDALKQIEKEKKDGESKSITKKRRGGGAAKRQAKKSTAQEEEEGVTLGDQLKGAESRVTKKVCNQEGGYRKKKGAS